MNAGTLQLQLPKKREGRVHDRKHIPDVEQPFKSLKNPSWYLLKKNFLGLIDGTALLSIDFETSILFQSSG